jgi:hypothetical protein
VCDFILYSLSIFISHENPNPSSFMLLPKYWWHIYFLLLYLSVVWAVSSFYCHSCHSSPLFPFRTWEIWVVYAMHIILSLPIAYQGCLFLTVMLTGINIAATGHPCYKGTPSAVSWLVISLMGCRNNFDCLVPDMLVWECKELMLTFNVIFLHVQFNAVGHLYPILKREDI